jgi:hypothetical protein
MASLPNMVYIKYLEPHLVVKILEFLQKNNSSNEDIKNLYIKILSSIQDFEKQKENKIFDDDKIAELKEKNEKEKQELFEKLEGFLNLSNNCIRENNFDLNSFSLGRKIIDETSPNLIIAYVKKLFDNLELNKAKDILTSFIKLNKIVNKNLSKIIYALYLLYSINILSNQDSKIIEKNFIGILKSLEHLKEHLDSEFRKTNFDSVDKIQVDFKEILLYRGYIIHWSLFLLESNVELFLDTLFKDTYFTLIENIFQYMYSYLIIFSILTKSKKYIYQIKESIKKINIQDDKFVDLFIEMFINYNIGNSVKLLEECKNIMKNDYFVYIYIDKFNEKCKETIIENYIFLNETIDLNDLSELFNKNIDDTKKYTKDVIKFNYPLAEIEEKDNNEIEIKNDEREMENYYNIKTQELFDLTSNMVQILKK